MKIKDWEYTLIICIAGAILIVTQFNYPKLVLFILALILYPFLDKNIKLK